MKIEDAKALTRKLMDEFGLKEPYWKIRITNHKSVAGRCYQRGRWNGKINTSGIIELSAPHIEVFDEKEVEDTIRHEIAHAWTDPKVKPHGKEWKASAIKIGARPERCVSIDAPRIDARYVGECTGGHKFTRHKRTNTVTSYQDSYCPKCSKKMPSGQYAFITWKDSTTGEVMNPRPYYPTVRTPVAAKTTSTRIVTVSKKNTGLDTSKPSTLSWKEKYDAGMTSFDNDW